MGSTSHLRYQEMTLFVDVVGLVRKSSMAYTERERRRDEEQIEREKAQRAAGAIAAKTLITALPGQLDGAAEQGYFNLTLLDIRCYNPSSIWLDGWMTTMRQWVDLNPGLYLCIHLYRGGDEAIISVAWTVAAAKWVSSDGLIYPDLPLDKPLPDLVQ